MSKEIGDERLNSDKTTLIFNSCLYSSSKTINQYFKLESTTYNVQPTTHITYNNFNNYNLANSPPIIQYQS